MLPLVQRELRVAARRKNLHRNRILSGVAVLLAGAGILVFANPAHPVRSGGVFKFCSFLALVVCLAEGMRKTADAISEEKRAGTLGLLFLTDLRGWDIVLGKLAGAMVQSFTALLAFVPILSLTLLGGGTTLGDFWRTVLALLVVLLFSLSLCLFVSVLSREKSLSACAFIFLSLLVVPWIGGYLLPRIAGAPGLEVLAMANPFTLLFQAWEAHYLAGPRFYWWGVMGYLAASFTLLAVASFVLPRIWQEKPRQVQVRRSRRRQRTEAKRRRRQLDQNPILWVAYHPGQARSFRILFYSILVACVGGRIALSYADWDPEFADALALVSPTILLNVYIASQSSMNLAEARRSGALELLLSTPLKVVDIVRGQILALKEMFLIPALLLAGCYILSAIGWTIQSGQWEPGLFLLMHLLQLGLGICAIAAVGMWMGMTSKTPNRALFKTLLIGMIFPYIICIPAFLVQLVLTAVANDRLFKNFRRYVAEKYLQDPSFRLAPVPSGDPTVPPVLR